MANLKAKGFHVQISNTFGYVLQEDAVADVIRDWEMQTMTSFSNWKKSKNFGQIGKNNFMYKPCACPLLVHTKRHRISYNHVYDRGSQAHLPTYIKALLVYFNIFV